jgi:hypothetical protein
MIWLNNYIKKFVGIYIMIMYISNQKKKKKKKNMKIFYHLFSLPKKLAFIISQMIIMFY